MTRLSQILAVESGVKKRAHDVQSDLYHRVQREPLLSGISRTYRPLNDEDPEKLPSQSTRVQVSADSVLESLRETLTRLFDVTYTKDEANTNARANVVVDGETLLFDVPVTFLLFLEKRLTDLVTFMRHLPVLDQAEDWTADAASGVYKTSVQTTHRTKKVPRVIVKYDATDKHPAQTELVDEDKIVGFWDTVKFSGALPRTRVDQLVHRAERLLDAVKKAREEANTIEVTDFTAGQVVFDYLLAP